MGLTVSHETANKLAIRRKNERILTVSHKNMLKFCKKNLRTKKVLRSFVESDVLCVYVFW